MYHVTSYDSRGNEVFSAAVETEELAENTRDEQFGEVEVHTVGIMDVDTGTGTYFPNPKLQLADHAEDIGETL